MHHRGTRKVGVGLSIVVDLANHSCPPIRAGLVRKQHAARPYRLGQSADRGRDDGDAAELRFGCRASPRLFPTTGHDEDPRARIYRAHVVGPGAELDVGTGAVEAVELSLLLVRQCPRANEKKWDVGTCSGYRES